MIETSRLVPRPFREEDAADVFEYWETPTANCFACIKLNFLELGHATVKEKTTHIVIEIRADYDFWGNNHGLQSNSSPSLRSV